MQDMPRPNGPQTAQQIEQIPIFYHSFYAFVILSEKSSDLKFFRANGYFNFMIGPRRGRLSSGTNSGAAELHRLVSRLKVTMRTPLGSLQRGEYNFTECNLFW